MWRSIARGLLLLAALLAAPAVAQNCFAATSQGTAPAGWQTYCWLDFTTYNDTTARTAAGQNFTFALTDGSTLSLNVRTTGTPAIQSRAAPSWTGAAVGNTAFLGIGGRPIFYQNAGGTNTITIRNILITPPPGAPAATIYSFVAADAESTNDGETLSFNTNGSAWTILDQVNPISGSTYPTISGVGTQTFTETGVPGTVGGYIVGSTSPTTVTTTLVGGGLQGAMFAVRFASIRLNKQIVGARVDPSDQFRFTIASTTGGTVIASGASSGTGLGPFTAAAAALASGLSLTLSESMAPGSASTLAQYRSRLTCTNDTGGSTTPLPNDVGATSFTFGALQFGDAVQCSFRNTPFPHLRLQKALGTGGRIFNTDQFAMSIANGGTTVATTTTTGTGSTVTNGSTANAQVTAGTAYSLSENAAGTTLLAQYTSTMTCTNVNASSSTALPTAAPGVITPSLGDVIACTITNTRRPANANLTVVKSSSVASDPFNGTINPKMIPGAFVSYAIGVTNTGTLAVDANSLFIVDPLPTSVTFNNAAPVTFANGSTPSGLTFAAGTNVRFSSSAAVPASFAACTYTPSAGLDPNVRHVCIRPSGAMAGATAGAQPSFTVSFQTQIN